MAKPLNNRKRAAILISLLPLIVLTILLYIRTVAPWYYVPNDKSLPIVQLVIVEESKDQIAIPVAAKTEYYSAFSKKHNRLHRFYFLAYLQREFGE